MIKSKEYIKVDGKVYEVVGKSGRYPVTKLIPGLKEIPVDEPLKAIREEAKEEAKEEIKDESEAPKRRRKRS